MSAETDYQLVYGAFVQNNEAGFFLKKELQHAFEISSVKFSCRIQKADCCVFSPLRMQSVGLALEELLVTAQKQDCLTVGIYESAKLLNA